LKNAKGVYPRIHTRHEGKRIGRRQANLQNLWA
jgi:hypothetical protein